MSTLRRRLAVFGSLLLLGSACGAIEHLACGDPCEGGVEPAVGAPMDFTLAGFENLRVGVSAPATCETIDDEDVQVVHVTTYGAEGDADPGTWIADRLAPELQSRGLSTGWGLGACADPTDDDAQGVRVFTSDWTEVDPIVRTIEDLAGEDDIALELTIAIEPVVIACPDVACGA